MALSKTYRTTIKKDKFESYVDVIVPFHGQYLKVTKLLESIMSHTLNVPYTLTLIDDCSDNEGYIDDLKKVKNLNLIRNKKRLGFGGSIFEGFKQTYNPWVCFINSDCVVDDLNWLQSMGSSLVNLKSQNVRMVAPLTNNAVGQPKQEISKDEYLKSADRKDYILNMEQDDPEYLSMYCFMCHRDLFKNCGGFIRDYPYGWYEDMEFAFRMKKFGFKQAICKNSWIFHEGACTIKSLWRSKPETRKIMEQENYELALKNIRELRKNNHI